MALAFDLAFKYRNPALIIADGVIGQMMEKVVLPPQQPRMTEAEIIKLCPWSTLGKPTNRNQNVITSLCMDPVEMEKINEHLQAKYRVIEENEVRFEEINCQDADYVIVAFGSVARISHKAMEMARQQGIKVGLLRPITLFPFPIKEIERLSKCVKGFLTVEMSAGQMVEDVRLAVNGKVPVEFYGRLGGVVPSPDEVVEALKSKLVK